MLPLYQPWKQVVMGETAAGGEEAQGMAHHSPHCSMVLFAMCWCFRLFSNCFLKTHHRLKAGEGKGIGQMVVLSCWIVKKCLLCVFETSVMRDHSFN